MSEGPVSRSLQGRSALVTGAGAGIGRAIATELVAAGADVLITYRSKADVTQATAEELNALGPGSCRATSLDIRSGEDVTRVIDEAIEAFEKLDIVVNNAGVTDDTLVMRMSEEAWDNVIETNLRGTFLISKAALRGMIRARWGRIINITSVVGRLGNPGQANYAAAKAGIIGFTRSLALEVATRGVTVNAIAPGFVETDMTAGLNEQQTEFLLGRIPMGRIAEPREIAPLAAFLASDAGSYITGQTFNVDGGVVMS